MTKLYEYSVLIGRFQPFHLAHKQLLNIALEKADSVIVILGSSFRARNIRSPWDCDEREAMITKSLSLENKNRVKFIYLRDYLYNETMWIAELQEKVSEASLDSKKILLVGHEHDKTSFYLKLFPQWDLLNVKNIDDCPHATKIRELYFTHDSEYKQYLSPEVVSYLESFKQTEAFKSLKSEFEFIDSYKQSWAGAPFKPTFVTIDSVVIKSGHVLLVRRRGALGKGLLALPGGFLNQDETVLTGALRELKEETAIKLSKEELENAVVDSKVFDHPLRSLRGRTISHAFLINLKSGDLPKVKGSDDADKAFWMPLSEAFSREEEFFEDHIDIIRYFSMKY